MTLRRIFMEVKSFLYMLWATKPTLFFIEEQERLHSTIPKTNAKQTKSNKKVFVFCHFRPFEHKVLYRLLNSRRNL